MNDFNKILKDCHNLNAIITELNKHYNLDQNFGIMTKSIVINGLAKIIKLLNIKKK